MEKKCSKCKTKKDIDKFHKDAFHLYGRHSWCKDCRRKMDRERDKLPSRVKKSKQYQTSKRGRSLANKRRIDNYAKNPKKDIAKRLIYQAIECGKLERQPCEVCSNPISLGHHDDYDKPLVVRWLCHTHHAEVHRAV